MCIIGGTPVDRLMEEIAARQRARRDWAYQDEMRRLRDRRGSAAELVDDPYVPRFAPIKGEQH